jgi:hypothetical protein
MTNFLDSLVMLLSTDWFKPYWVAIGINLDESKKGLMQEGCREVVSQILSGATEYWLTSFSDERREETRAMFESLAKKSGAEEAVAETAKEWFEMFDEDLKAGSLFEILTGDLLSDNVIEDGPLPCSDIRAVVARAREEQDFTEIDFNKLCTSSKSSWDRYMRELTPELPTSLSDTLLIFLRTRSFKALWTSIEGKLTPEQREELTSWYRAAAKLRAKRDIAPSYFPGDGGNADRREIFRDLL